MATVDLDMIAFRHETAVARMVVPSEIRVRRRRSTAARRPRHPEASSGDRQARQDVINPIAAAEGVALPDAVPGRRRTYTNFADAVRVDGSDSETRSVEDGEDGELGTPWMETVAKVCFFLCGLGVATCWTLLRSAVGFYAQNFPARGGFYAQLLAAYNIPVVPLLLAQAALDASYDSRFGSINAYTFRVVVGMGGLVAVLALATIANEGGTIAAAAVTGVLDSTVFGTASKLGSVWVGTSFGYYFLGASATALVAIGLGFATGLASAHPTRASVEITMGAGAAVVGVGLIATLYLLRTDLAAKYLASKDAENNDTDEELSPAAPSGTSTPGPPPSPKQALSLRTVLAASWPTHLGLVLSLMTDLLGGSMIGFVPTESGKPGTLATPLLYTSLIASLLGKQLNVFLGTRPFPTQTAFLGAAAVKVLFLLPYLLYVAQPAIGRVSVRSDAIPFLWQACNDMFGAYFSSLAYTHSAALFDRVADKSQAASYLSLSLMAGVYIGLGLSFAIQAAL
jgi:hypothetical protein